MFPQTKPEEPEANENPFVLAVTVKDEHGDIDLAAIAESENLINIRLISVPSDQYLLFQHFLCLSH